MVCYLEYVGKYFIYAFTVSARDSNRDSDRDNSLHFYLNSLICSIIQA